MKKILAVLGFIICINLSVKAQIIRYVAPNSIGTADGLSAGNASDFLEVSFWQSINGLLQTQPVVVKFVAGNYVRAYTEQPLILNTVGNAVNTLTLEGDVDNTIFTAPTGHNTKDVMMEIVNSQNIVVKDFYFTGNGSIGYVFRVTSGSGKTSRNILIENCSWENMRGIIYGASGTAQPTTSYVTFKNCTFKNIGLNSGSHMIYNAYDAHHISVIDSHFEDCTGDYVRFRDNLDYAIVKNSTFIRNAGFVDYPFIAMPLFNDVNPGDEFFATNYSFFNNTFTNAAIAIQFLSSGFDPVGRNHLLTAAEGTILTGGTDQQKKDLLRNNFKINTDLVRIHNNTYNTISKQVVIRTTAAYGSVSKGWVGEATISNLFNSSGELLPWEQDYYNVNTQWVETGTLKNINWEYSFVGTSGTVSGEGGIIKTSTLVAENFLPKPTSGTVEISSGIATTANSSSFTLNGTNALTIVGNNNSTPSKFITKGFAYNSQVMSAHFTLKLNNAPENKSAVWYIVVGGETSSTFNQGNSPSISGNSSADATIYTVLRLRKSAVGGTYTLQARYHNTTATNSVNWGWHQLGSGLMSGEDVKIDLYCNNSSSAQSYTVGAAPYNLVTKAYHVWVNDARVGTDGTAEQRLIRNFRRNNASNPAAGNDGHTGNLSAIGITSREAATSEVDGVTFDDNSATTTISNLKIAHLGNLTPLPVTLTNFSGGTTNNGITLKWNTTYEKDNNYFIIKRSSNEKDFKEIAKIFGNGDTDALTHYTYVDKSPLSGYNYYQLVQVDRNGTENSYDKTVAIDYSVGKNIFKVINLSKNHLRIIASSEVTETAQLIVTDISGRVVYKDRKLLNSGSNIFEITIPWATSGVYITKLLSASKSKNIKVLL